MEVLADEVWQKKGIGKEEVKLFAAMILYQENPRNFVEKLIELSKVEISYN